MDNKQPILDDLIKLILTYFPKIVQSIIILLVGFFIINKVMKMLDRALKKSKIDQRLYSIIKQSIKILLRLFIVLSAINTLGIVDESSVVAILGTLGLSISLAAKDSASDMASGLVLLLNKQFNIGDYVDIGANSGTVNKTTLTYVCLSKATGKEIFIPNSTVAKSVITNHSIMEKRIVETSIKFSANNDLEVVKKIIHQSIVEVPEVLDNKDIELFLSEFSSASNTILVRFCVDQSNYKDILYKINESIKKAFELNNVEL